MLAAAFIRTLLITGLVEGGLALVYARLHRYPSTPLLALVLIMNGFTQTILWLALIWRGATAYWTILLPGELFIWLVEGLAFYGYLRSGREAWGLSLLLNGTSFALGLVLHI